LSVEQALPRNAFPAKTVLVHQKTDKKVTGNVRLYIVEVQSQAWFEFGLFPNQFRFVTWKSIWQRLEFNLKLSLTDTLIVPSGSLDEEGQVVRVGV
jgi:hypothetical protein